MLGVYFVLLPTESLLVFKHTSKLIFLTFNTLDYSTLRLIEGALLNTFYIVATLTQYLTTSSKGSDLLV